MATSSIYHSVTVRDRYLSRALITALEKSKANPAKPVNLSKKVQEVKGEDIRKLFGESD